MGREPRATSSNAGRKSTTLDAEYRDSSNTSRKRKSAYLDQSAHRKFLSFYNGRNFSRYGR